MFYIFYGCKGLISVTIPNSVTAIGHSAFEFCSGLTSLNIPNSVTSIGSYAFSGCNSLTSVDIPNSVTSIQQSAFQGCTVLTTLNIGNAVKEIDSNAFAQCSNLTDVYSTVEELSSSRYGQGLFTYNNAFDGSYIEYVTLHVPAGSINTYKGMEPWNKFKEIITIDGDIPETPDTPVTPEKQKCSKPTITYINGEITFSCETEGVEFISEVTAKDENKYNESEIAISNVYQVSVYAQKEGYENSDTATQEIVFKVGKLGDLTGDGKVNVADHVKLSEIIMNEK